MTQGLLKRFEVLLTLVLALILAQGTAFAVRDTDARHTGTRHTHRLSRLRRHLRWNPMFRPSHDSLLRQNEEIDRLGLPRIVDDDELEALKTSGDLVPIKETESLKIERSLDPSRRYCRP